MNDNSQAERELEPWMRWIAGDKTAIFCIVGTVLLSGLLGFVAGSGRGYDRGYAEATVQSEQRIKREVENSLAAHGQVDDLAARLEQCMATSQVPSSPPSPPAEQPSQRTEQPSQRTEQPSQPSRRQWGVLWEKDSPLATCSDRVEYVPYLYVGGPRGRRWDKLQCRDDICNIVNRDLGQHEVWLEMLELAKGWTDDEVIALGVVQVQGEKQIYICDD